MYKYVCDVYAYWLMLAGSLLPRTCSARGVKWSVLVSSYIYMFVDKNKIESYYIYYVL